MGPLARRIVALQLLLVAELELMKSTLPIEYHSNVLNIIVAPGKNTENNYSRTLSITADALYTLLPLTMK